MSDTPLNLPCINYVPCFPCYVSPIANLTSEAGDGPIFVATSHVDPGNEPFVPTIGRTWTSTYCLATCTSSVSQSAADLCAKNLVSDCEFGNNPGTQLFPSTPQSCSVLCPDGSLFTFTVPAGYVVMFNQEQADAMAHQYACQQAAINRICFGNLPRCTCVGTPYSRTVSVSGGRGHVIYTVYSGILPPGLSLFGGDGSFRISGTPIVHGTYAFTIQGVDELGNFMRKEYSIVVLEITTTSLPPFSIGTPYSFQLVASGGSGNYNFKIDSGSLPPGLTMSITGLISGTPT